MYAPLFLKGALINLKELFGRGHVFFLSLRRDGHLMEGLELEGAVLNSHFPSLLDSPTRMITRAVNTERLTHLRREEEPHTKRCDERAPDPVWRVKPTPS